MNSAFLATLFGMCNGLDSLVEPEAANTVLANISDQTLAEKFQMEKRRRASGESQRRNLSLSLSTPQALFQIHRVKIPQLTR